MQSSRMGYARAKQIIEEGGYLRHDNILQTNLVCDKDGGVIGHVTYKTQWQLWNEAQQGNLKLKETWYFLYIFKEEIKL